MQGILAKALVASATTAVVDPEPFSKTVAATVTLTVATTLAAVVTTEIAMRGFRWVFDRNKK